MPDGRLRRSGELVRGTDWLCTREAWPAPYWPPGAVESSAGEDAVARLLRHIELVQQMDLCRRLELSPAAALRAEADRSAAWVRMLREERRLTYPR